MCIRDSILVGRDLQKEEGMLPQIAMTMPLREGLDGVRKMSKSYGNYAVSYTQLIFPGWSGRTECRRKARGESRPGCCLLYTSRCV